MLKFTLKHKPWFQFARKSPPFQDWVTPDDLAKRVANLHLSPPTTPTINDSIFTKPPPTPPLVFRRYFSTSPQLLDDHLDSQYAIKKELIEQRRQFLADQGMLENRMIYEGREVYANTHLFKLHKKDRRGRTNLERMRAGLCPIDGTHDLIIVHHLDQSHSGSWVILTDDFHKRYHKELHSKVTVKDYVKRPTFNNEKKRYWKFMAELLCEDEYRLKRPGRTLT